MTKVQEYNLRYRAKRKLLKAGGEIPVDYFKVNIPLPAPPPDEGLTRSELCENIRGKIDEITIQSQKDVRKEWARHGYKNNIIIITPGAVRNKKDVPYTCEIHQLHMKKADTELFTKLCRENLEINFKKCISAESEEF